MKNRFIFDLDGTLMDGDFTKEKDFFHAVLSGYDLTSFLRKTHSYITEYEKTHDRYDIDAFGKFLSEKTSLPITGEIIEEWIHFGGDIDNDVFPYVYETLEYLKRENCSITLYTNWFQEAQEARLKKEGLLSYFDDIYGGDIILKPNRYGYYMAAGRYPIEECVMFGDNMINDVLGPREIGMDSYHITKEKGNIKLFQKIRERKM